MKILKFRENGSTFVRVGQQRQTRAGRRKRNLVMIRRASPSKITESKIFTLMHKLSRPNVKPAEPIVLGVSRKGITEWAYWPRVSFAALMDMREGRITAMEARAVFSAYSAALEYFQEHRQWPGYGQLDKLLSEMRHPE